MPERSFPSAILEHAARITGKRARLVVDRILEFGTVTTEELKELGYDHPPRAIKDVTDQGLPLARSWAKRADGRGIAVYTFGDPDDIRGDRSGGRQTLSKAFRLQVCVDAGGRCGVCHTLYESRYLQTDHRIPFEVAGESADRTAAAYMPLCGSCNRAKSWSCEHCPNWQAKDPAVCAICYWARPDDYQHVATRDLRRLDLVWEGHEVADFDRAATDAEAAGIPLPEFVKQVLRTAHPPIA